MKLTEILMVIHSHKGKQENYLLTEKDYVKFLKDTGLSEKKVEHNMLLIQKSKSAPSIYVTESLDDAYIKTSYTKDIDELAAFVRGDMNDGPHHLCIKRCSQECMDFLKENRIRKRGRKTVNKKSSI